MYWYLAGGRDPGGWGQKLLKCGAAPIHLGEGHGPPLDLAEYGNKAKEIWKNYKLVKEGNSHSGHSRTTITSSMSWTSSDALIVGWSLSASAAQVSRQAYLQWQSLFSLIKQMLSADTSKSVICQFGGCC